MLVKVRYSQVRLWVAVTVYGEFLWQSFNRDQLLLTSHSNIPATFLCSQRTWQEVLNGEYYVCKPPEIHMLTHFIPFKLLYMQTRCHQASPLQRGMWATLCQCRWILGGHGPVAPCLGWGQLRRKKGDSWYGRPRKVCKKTHHSWFASFYLLPLLPTNL